MMAHLTHVRGLLSQERIEDEVKDEMILLMKSVLPNIGNFQVMVAVNGEEVMHCDAVVKEALKNFVKNESWHFVRRSNLIKSYTVSKTIDKLKSKKPRLSVLCD